MSYTQAQVVLSKGERAYSAAQKICRLKQAQAVRFSLLEQCLLVLMLSLLAELASSAHEHLLGDPSRANRVVLEYMT